MIYLLDLLGVAIFAVTGALAAGRKRMDIFGIVVVAIVTALGGGTLRDIILGSRNVLWVCNPTYVIVAAAAALATFVYPRFIKYSQLVLLVFDAFGLAVFTVIGCQKALEANVSSYIIAVLMGVMTGVAGGIGRDVLCGEIPLILRREVYATASLVGGVLFVGMSRLGVNKACTTVVAASMVLVVRLAAIRFGLSLPVFVTMDAKASSLSWRDESDSDER
ncbi:MAG: trimeric intracellular cation channel family protein [Armatimonadetes bacterium]|nr:trimeric intracellular cation channel family protein [Armatimonadota bacterium]